MMAVNGVCRARGERCGEFENSCWQPWGLAVCRANNHWGALIGKQGN